MKRMVVAKSNTDALLALDVDVLFHLASDLVYATDIRPVDNDGVLDSQAAADFDNFIDNLFALLDYYDFEVFESYRKKSGSYPYTSRYQWIAHRTEIDADRIHKLIRLRVSDHYQKFSKRREHELSQQAKKEAYDLRQPSSKKSQRYEFKMIVVNNERFTTYEEALNYAEKEIRSWLIEKNVDISKYEDFGEW